MSKNGTFLSPNNLDSCLNQPVPDNVTRVPFPVQNGRAIFDLVNKTSGGVLDDSFFIDLYLPHLWYQYLPSTDYNTGVQNTYQKSQTMWRWNGWQNFVDGKKCYLPLNMTEMIVDKDNNALSASDLEGLHVTLTFQIMNGRNYRAFEQVDEVDFTITRTSEWDRTNHGQCAYVTLTNEDLHPPSNGDLCDTYKASPVDPAHPTPSKSGANHNCVSVELQVYAGFLLVLSIIWFFNDQC
jgi:hypothetical protein